MSIPGFRVESLFLGLPLEGSLGPFKRFFYCLFQNETNNV